MILGYRVEHVLDWALGPLPSTTEFLLILSIWTIFHQFKLVNPPHMISTALPLTSCLFSSHSHQAALPSGDPSLAGASTAAGYDWLIVLCMAYLLYVCTHPGQTSPHHLLPSMRRRGGGARRQQRGRLPLRREGRAKHLHPRDQPGALVANCVYLVCHYSPIFYIYLTRPPSAPSAIPIQPSQGTKAVGRGKAAKAAPKAAKQAAPRGGGRGKAAKAPKAAPASGSAPAPAPASGQEGGEQVVIVDDDPLQGPGNLRQVGVLVPCNKCSLVYAFVLSYAASVHSAMWCLY